MDTKITYTSEDAERISIIRKVCDFILSDIKEKIVGKDLYLAFDEQLSKWCIRGSENEIIIVTNDLYQAIAYLLYFEEYEENNKTTNSDFVKTTVGNWIRYARKKDNKLSGSINST